MPATGTLGPFERPQRGASAATDRSRHQSDRPHDRDRWAIPISRPRAPSCRRWSPTLPPRSCPALYRAVLDRVARARGERTIASSPTQVRAEATRIYSRAWDERARRGLTRCSDATPDEPLGQPRDRARPPAPERSAPPDDRAADPAA